MHIVNSTILYLGMIIPGIFLLLCGYYGSTTKWAIVFLSLAIGFIGFSGSGVSINNLDIAPKYAGILMGIANTIGTIPGFVGPQVAKFIAKKVSVKMYESTYIQVVVYACKSSQAIKKSV